jgi:hypothetical protein
MYYLALLFFGHVFTSVLGPNIVTRKRWDLGHLYFWSRHLKSWKHVNFIPNRLHIWCILGWFDIETGTKVRNKCFDPLNFKHIHCTYMFNATSLLYIVWLVYAKFKEIIHNLPCDYTLATLWCGSDNVSNVKNSRIRITVAEPEPHHLPCDEGTENHVRWYSFFSNVQLCTLRTNQKIL